MLFSVSKLLFAWAELFASLFIYTSISFKILTVPIKIPDPDPTEPAFPELFFTSSLYSLSGTIKASLISHSKDCHMPQ